MQSCRGLFLLCSLLLSVVVFAQVRKIQNSDPLANSLLARSVNAISGGMQIRDVVETGKVRQIAGSTDERGDAELKALISGEVRIDLSVPSGSLYEVYAKGERGLVGEWSRQDQKPHPIAIHNLFIDQAWFCPAILLERLSSAGENKIVTFAGTVNSGGHSQELLHIASRPITQDKTTIHLPDKITNAIEKAKQFDLYLNPATSLPVEMDFQAHPDNNAGQDIPVRIRYSDYRSVNGIQVPFHVRKFLNNTLFLDFQFESASFNTGLAADSFVVTTQTTRSLPQ